MIWKVIAYASILTGLLGLGLAAFLLHRIGVQLSRQHPSVFRDLGEPRISQLATWPQRRLLTFVTARAYEALEDPELTALCGRFRALMLVVSGLASIGFVSVFAEAFSRAA